MRQHTPEPWEAEEWVDKWAIKAGKYVIVSVYKDANNPSEAEANAKLIAAASLQHGQLQTGIATLNLALTEIYIGNANNAIAFIRGVIAGNEIAIAKATEGGNDGTDAG